MTQQQHKDTDQVFAILVEPEGKIFAFENKKSNPFSFDLKKGNQIDNCLPVFIGIFPLHTDELILENVSSDQFKGNIIIKNHQGEVSVRFYESHKAIELWERVVRKYNQDKLIKNLTMKSGSSLSGSVLYALGFMSFEKQNSGFKLLGNIPNWFKLLFPSYNYSSLVFDLVELFPFLEVFMPQAELLFNNRQDGKVISGLWTAYSPEGEEVILQATAVYETGGSYIFIESISDRSPDKHKNLQRSREQSLAFEQLIKTEEVLRNVLKYREQFISIFAHDIIGPIGGIFSLIGILREDEEFMAGFKTNHAHLFNVIYKDLRDLHDYSSKLHDWSNIHFGNIKLNMTEVDLGLLVSNIITSLNKKISSKRINIEVAIPKGLQVFVDEVFFKNALYNLITNAIKFSYQMGEIHISASDLGTETFIQIKDEGAGMDKNVMDSMFNFEDKKSTIGTGGEKGTGIGLTIVKKILDIHGANIQVGSILNKGTTITIKVPHKTD